MSQSDNKLLAALPRLDYQRLRPFLRTLNLSGEMGLPHCGHTRVYFPGTGLCSIINTMADGGSIEVACIGNEGAVGLQSLAGECPQDRNGFVQVADGTVQYLPIVFFEREFARNGKFREVVDRFCQSFLETVIQAVACNRLHTIEERCCRWLLGVHDRLGRVRFELKTRFLARAMGSKNSEVGAIIASLEVRGLVQHDGESIIIVDAVGLRRLACRCYDTMKRGYAPARTVPQAKQTKRAKNVLPPARNPRTSGPAKVLEMRRPGGACTLCGSSTGVPHRSGHECILALDQEIGALVERTHLLRKYRTQLMANRAQLYRDILRRSIGRI